MLILTKHACVLIGEIKITFCQTPLAADYLQRRKKGLVILKSNMPDSFPRHLLLVGDCVGTVFFPT